MEYLFKSGIYAIYNKISNKVYVGSAKVLSRRWDEHKKYLRRNIHKNPHLQSSWNNYQETDFDFYVLEFVEFEDLLLAEQIWLDKISQTYEVYNCRMQVSGRHGTRLSEETKRKISETKKAQNLKFSHTEETKKLLSNYFKGIKRKPLTEEHKNKISQNHLRQPMSDSNKLKLIEAHAIEFSIKDPAGNIYFGKNLAEFCREHNLNPRAISAVLSGKRRHHKKWTLPDQNIDLNLKRSHREFDLIDLNGTRYQGTNLTEFCRIKNLNYKGMLRMIYGKRSHYKNWKVYQK